VDAIVMLKEDHKMVEKLFKQFEKAADDAYAEKEQIVEQVILALTQHAYVEETIFYPTAREASRRPRNTCWKASRSTTS
jgi:hemerythrin superfamily protein